MTTTTISTCHFSTQELADQLLSRQNTDDPDEAFEMASRILMEATRRLWEHQPNDDDYEPGLLAEAYNDSDDDYRCGS